MRSLGSIKFSGINFYCILAAKIVDSMIGGGFLRNLFGRRTLLYQLVRRDYEQRFVGSSAGWLWGMIHPMVMIASWTIVFQFFMKSDVSPGEVTDNYVLFLICGYLPWMLFSETLQRSATSLLDQSNLITKTVFPSELIPISIFLSALLNHLLALSLALLPILYWQGELSPMILMLPVYMVLIGLMGIGLGWEVASLQVYLRDTAQMLMVVLTFWFWMTPIFISTDKVPERFQFLIRGNPMSYVVKAYRERLLSMRAPNLHELMFVTVAACVLFIIGGLFFKQLKRGFADVL